MPPESADAAWAPARPHPQAKVAVSIDETTIAQAEKLAGVRYTPAERRQMLTSVEEHLERARLLHLHRQPHTLSPATVYLPPVDASRIPTSLPASDGTPWSSITLSNEAPRDAEAIAFASVAQLSRWLERGHITSMQLTRLYLERLRTIGRRLECVVTTTEELALEQAARADKERARGRVRGPLHGIPWGAKDIIDTRGIPTTWGATPFADRIPGDDATVVSRLDEAGAVLVAKLTTGALAYSDIWHGGRTRNPWNPVEGSGGSSAGPAAAVAAGCVAFALGTETLGSILSPSLRCGCVGLRPTFGRIPRTGCMPLCWSLDKVGPITRRVADAWTVLRATHGPDGHDLSARPMPLGVDSNRSLADLRIGYDPAWFRDANAVERHGLETLRALGAELVAIELPDLPYDALLVILFAESAAAFEDLTLDDLDDTLMWQTERAWPNTFRSSRFISAIDYLSAQRLRTEVLRVFDRLFADVDLMFGPHDAPSMLLATNSTGHPSLAVRAGFVERPPEPDLDGYVAADQRARLMPEGVVLWGRLGGEGTLCRAGAALEAALGVSDRAPSV